MDDLAAITGVECRYTEHGEPSLGEAYELLQSRWNAGGRDRETALRLLFLAWYSCSEPPFLTGLSMDAPYADVFADVFSHLGEEQSSDPEFLFAVGVMATSFPYCIGPESEWEAVGKRCVHRAAELRPEGFEPGWFEGRGAYGNYFAHMLRHGEWDRLTRGG
jgi:hypothetical protein